MPLRERAASNQRVDRNATTDETKRETSDDASDALERASLDASPSQAGAGGLRVAPDESTFGPQVRVAARLDRDEAFEAIVARGPAMRGLLERAARAAQSESPLTLEGEPGCGKRAIAKLVHELSPRRDMPFVRVDCAAHDEASIEGELFGVRRGAESRAERDREGLVQTAHRGTLLLENLADLPAVVQPKLQEFLTTGEFRPVGDRWGTRCADVRVIVSSSVPLAQPVAAGRLRRALYDRVAVLSLSVPCLRERVEDIEPLFERFAEHFADATESTGEGESSEPSAPLSIDREALDWLRAYPWPGNVRELQNAVEYACLMGRRERVGCEDLPESIRRHAKPCGMEPLSGEFDQREGADLASERERIAAALQRSEGDLDGTARMLGMSRRALRYAVARAGLETAEPARPAKPRVPGERLQAALNRQP